MEDLWVSLEEYVLSKRSWERECLCRREVASGALKLLLKFGGAPFVIHGSAVHYSMLSLIRARAAGAMVEALKYLFYGADHVLHSTFKSLQKASDVV